MDGRDFEAIRAIKSRAGFLPPVSAAATIDRLAQTLGFDRDANMAECLGLTPAALAEARTRDRLPMAVVVSAAIRFGLSLDWLVLGRTPPGPATREAA